MSEGLIRKSSMDERPIRLRGHHLFCMNIADFTGDPIYNSKFCRNARNYQERLRNNPDQLVGIVPHCGDTCRCCPSWNEADDKCFLYDYHSGANQIDLKVLQSLGLSIGNEITISELRRGIKDAYGNKLPDMCFTECGFMDLLHCQEGLDKLQTEVPYSHKQP